MSKFLQHSQLSWPYCSFHPKRQRKKSHQIFKFLSLIIQYEIEQNTELCIGCRLKMPVYYVEERNCFCGQCRVSPIYCPKSHHLYTNCKPMHGCSRIYENIQNGFTPKLISRVQHCRSQHASELPVLVGEIHQRETIQVSMVISLKKSPPLLLRRRGLPSISMSLYPIQLIRI